MQEEQIHWPLHQDLDGLVYLATGFYDPTLLEWKMTLSGGNRSSGVFGRNGAKAFNSVAQSISDNTETTVNFGAEAYDTNSFHDNSVNNSRLTIPTGVTKIRLTGYVNWTPNGSSFRLLKIRKNGANGPIDDDQTTYQPQIFVSAANASVPELGMYIDSGIITVAAVDFFELRVFQNSGISLFMLDEDCWFQIEVIE